MKKKFLAFNPFDEQDETLLFINGSGNDDETDDDGEENDGDGEEIEDLNFGNFGKEKQDKKVEKKSSSKKEEKEEDDNDEKKEEEEEEEEKEEKDDDENEDDDDDDDDDDKEESKDDDKKEKSKKEKLLLDLDDEDFSIDGDVEFNKIAKSHFDIELEENTLEAFVEGINKKIKSASKKVEIDRSKYQPETIELIDMLEAGATRADFINESRQFDNFLALPDEDKLLNYFVNIDEMKKDDAQAKIDQLIEEGKLKDAVKKVNQTILAWKNKELSDTVTKVKQRTLKASEEEKKEIKKERMLMVSELKKMKTFMGLDVSDKALKVIERKINTGEVVEELNRNPQSLVKAYLLHKFENVILESIGKSIKTASKKGYNEADRKNKDRLQNKEGDRTNSRSQRSVKQDLNKPFKGLNAILEEK